VALVAELRLTVSLEQVVSKNRESQKRKGVGDFGFLSYEPSPGKRGVSRIFTAFYKSKLTRCEPLSTITPRRHENQAGSGMPIRQDERPAYQINEFARLCTIDVHSVVRFAATTRPIQNRRLGSLLGRSGSSYRLDQFQADGPTRLCFDRGAINDIGSNEVVWC
jgi:hypothetical protein